MLVTLTYLFFIEEKTGKNTGKIVKVTELVIPAYISDTPLEVELVWQQLKADRIKAKQPVEYEADKTINNKDVLTLGDNKYALFGIFNASKHTNESTIAIKNSGMTNDVQSKAFILIKALNKKDKSHEAQMFKVMQGEQLSDGITLLTVTSNSIMFRQGTELIEFKLFEPKSIN
jgi:hypothetical protein